MKVTNMDFKQLSNRICTISGSFVDLRKFNYIYVDKTREIYDLASQRDFFFLSRPRRFGKSTIVSTLDELFRHGVSPYDGHDSYFKGLAIENLWSDNEQYRVFHLDLSTIQGKPIENAEIYEQELIKKIDDFANDYGLKINSSSNNVFNHFESVLKQISDHSLVFLVDEYDFALTKSIDLPQNFKDITDVLKKLYTALKVYAIKFRFCFITGITRYKDSSVFTAGSPINDISFDDEYGTITGITKEELTTFYPDHLKWVASKQHNKDFDEVTKEDIEETLYEIANWYDGYSFDKNCKTHVFTTWSILKLFKDKEGAFDTYWYDVGGTPLILRKSYDKIINNKSLLLNGELEVPVNVFDNPTSFADMDPRVLLFQTGYLSFYKAKDKSQYYLKFPNKEVYSAFSDYLLEKAYKQNNEEYSLCYQDKDKLEKAKTIEEIIDYFNEILNLVDYEHFPLTSEAAVVTCLHIFLKALDRYQVNVNYHSALGRADLVVDSISRRLVFEFKYCKDENEDKLLETAKAQMLEKRYAKTANAPTTFMAIAAVYDSNKRKLTKFAEVNY